MESEKVAEYIKRLGADAYVIRTVKSDVEQVRFSNSEKDLSSMWDQMSVDIFMSKGKRTTELSLNNDRNIMERIEKAYRGMLKGEESSSFNGINDHSYSSINRHDQFENDLEMDDLVSACISGSREEGADRSTGIVYHHRVTDHITTPYNEHEAHYESFDFEVRSFKGNNTGQEGIHFGPSQKDGIQLALEAGRESGRTASMVAKDIEFSKGNYDTVLSPYVIGNILSYCDFLFSAYSVRSGISYLDRSMGKTISSKKFTLTDEPLQTGGSEYCYFDDEGTPTMDKTIIENGVLKTFLHSYSTARDFGTQTTGNAGIISPSSLQLAVKPGNSSVDSMISSMDRGLFIKNAWYTRFQDNRNAVFSTVPRDGIFVVEHGEIVGRIRGVRIADSFSNIINNIDSVSAERKNVKFWEEVKPSIMPYVTVRNLGMTTAF